MSIGEALAQARCEAGLSITDVSRRTRIRETLIGDIERDDYHACGGDFYVRGHIRAIARAVGTDPGPLIEEYDAARLTEQAMTADVSEPPRLPAGVMVRERHRVNWTAVLGLAFLAAVGFGGYLLVSGGFHPSRATSVATHQVSSRPAAHLTPGQGSSASRTAPSASPSRSAAPANTGPPVRALHPAGITAFGPGGSGQGDNPHLAPSALTGNPAAPWHSDWYTTAHFGNLQPGTGLLLDMGRTVTITTARIALGSGAGATVELRVGRRPDLAALRPVARAADVSGMVRLRPAATARGRYVLVWFTKLPTDPAGTFQVSVYRVRLRGNP